MIVCSVAGLFATPAGQAEDQIARLMPQGLDELTAIRIQKAVEDCWRSRLPELARAPVDPIRGQGLAFDRILRECREQVAGMRDH